MSGKGNRLNADVVPSVTFRRYVGTRHIASGITFWTKAGVRIINYPKLYLENGAQKNNACNVNYKPNIRVFKNSKNILGSDFPSYFLECILFNVPTHHFSNSYSDTFYQVLSFLEQAKNDGSLSTFQCQNEQQRIFGSEPHQTNLESVRSIIGGLIRM